MTKPYTRELCEKLQGKFVVLRIGPETVYKVVGGHDHRLRAIPFGKNHEVHLQTRKFRAATESEIARACVRRLEGET